MVKRDYEVVVQYLEYGDSKGLEMFSKARLVTHTEKLEQLDLLDAQAYAANLGRNGFWINQVQFIAPNRINTVEVTPLLYVSTGG